MEIIYKKSNDKRLNDQMKVKIALLQPDIQKSTDECLSDPKLAALVDNRLDSKTNDRILKHIDSCDSCYMKWVEIFSFSRKKPKPRKKTIIKQYQHEFITGLMALAAVIIIYLLPLTPPPDPLHNLFKIAISNNITYESLNYNSQATIENQIKRYMTVWQQKNIENRRKLFQEKVAFVTGIYSASQQLSITDKPNKNPEYIDVELMKQIDQEETSLSIFYNLGRWCLLLKAIAESTMTIPGDLWKEHFVFIETMSHKIEKCDDILKIDKNLILSAFKTFNDHLNKNPQDFSNFEKRILISKEIEQVINILLSELK